MQKAQKKARVTLSKMLRNEWVLYEKMKYVCTKLKPLIKKLSI